MKDVIESWLVFKSGVLIIWQVQISKTQYINIKRKEKQELVNNKEILNKLEPWKTANVFKKNVTIAAIAKMTLPNPKKKKTWPAGNDSWLERRK